tara:strand:- start:406 stop:876 length:471 start_codon:yes stop_codon:yes gene_type:complete
MNKDIKTIFNDDMKLGISGENYVEEKILPRYFKNIKFNGKWAVIDYENEDTLIELKTRRVPFGKYESLMFGFNKVVYIEERIKNGEKKDAYIIWKLTDGVYYWKYNENEYSIKSGGRRDRGKLEFNDCAYVKNKYIHSIYDLCEIKQEENEETEVV